MASPTTKKLFTPGPLTTSESVKQAMLRDVGSRDTEFVDLVRNLREALLEVAGVSQEDGYEAVIVQGSGTFGLEAVISSVIPRDGKLLVATNGIYGERLDRIAAIHGVPRIVVRSAEDAPLCQESIRRTLLDDPAITHVAMVHCETSTGMLNAVEELADVVASAGRRTIVDSMSGFGAVPIDLKSCPFDYLVSSVSKGLEGVPGACFVLCRRAELQETAGWARTLSLDLFEQWRGLERNGQFRFTPPTHVLLAAHQAVLELGEEGGVAARAARYRTNHRRLPIAFGSVPSAGSSLETCAPCSMRFARRYWSWTSRFPSSESVSTVRRQSLRADDRLAAVSGTWPAASRAGACEMRRRPGETAPRPWPGR